MMNHVWSFIFIISVFFSFLSGNISKLETALLESSASAVDFTIGLCGIMAMWSGLMEIAAQTGLINKLSSVLLPFTKILFPNQRNPEILSSIIMSFMSNIFGAGNSSTIFALKTMEKLDAQNNNSTIASNDMCTFAVVNMTIAPIMPIITIKLRTEANALDPYSTVIPSIITTLVCILVAIIVCKYYERKSS